MITQASTADFMSQAQPNAPTLSVVIVSWNAQAYVRECLESLCIPERQAFTEIIVVDNASSDATSRMVKEQFPAVKLIQNEANLGFAKANNLGLSLCKGRYVCLVNSDVRVLAGCVEKMLEYMERNPSVGLLGPAMVGADFQVRRSCMKLPTLWNSLCYALALDSLFKSFAMFSSFLMRDFRHDLTSDVEVLNGWFWMVRRQALDQVGGLDERFFMYGEDVDWCKRFADAGWRIVFFPEAKAIHYGGASSATVPLRCYLQLQRARIQYWEKHHHPASHPLFFIVLVAEQLARLVGYAIACTWKATRSQAIAKFERSAASLRWLLGSRHPLGEVNE